MIARTKISQKRVFKIENILIQKKRISKSDISLLQKGDFELQDVWYLPHHPVVNLRKPEKVRRVCNAAKSFRGYCLNDVLMKGPLLLQNLTGILFRL